MHIKFDDDQPCRVVTEMCELKDKQIYSSQHFAGTTYKVTWVVFDQIPF